MFCIIAAERESAQIIKQELQKSFIGWEFETCSDAHDLDAWTHKTVDVLLVSRFLPGDTPNNLLSRLKLLFPATHIVLLVGEKSDKQQLYIKNAKNQGLYNIVTGQLPGDRPYTIFEAFTNAREPDLEGYSAIEELNSDAEETLPENTFEITEEIKELNSSNNGNTENPSKIGELENEVARLRQLIEMLGANKRDYNEQRELTHNHGVRGIVVCSASNKGGVGKTTVSVALATALANAGVSTVVTDYDLGSPNIAGYTGITNKSGIEALAGRPIRHNNLRDLIIKRGNLDVLPGVMNKTIPNFRKGQLLEIINALAEIYAVVVVDTPPEYWTKPWLFEIFGRADYILAITDQSILTECDSENYAPALLAMGATPEKIGIVLNKYSPKLHNPRKVEKIFCAGFKKDIKNLPRIVAVIPENWNEHVQRGYKGEVAGLDDVHNQWHRLAESIAKMAGYGYKKDTKKPSIIDKLISKTKMRRQA